MSVVGKASQCLAKKVYIGGQGCRRASKASMTTVIAVLEFSTDSNSTSNQRILFSLCQSVQTHVTSLLIHWHLFAICSLLIVVDAHNSCHNGLEVELQSSL